MTADIPPGVPRDYMLALPDGWCRIPLEPSRRQRAIRDLIRRQLTGLDQAPLLKARLRRDLADRAEAAWQAGGIELYLSFMAAGPLPLAASMLVTLIPPPPDGPIPPAALAAALAAPGRATTRRRLPAGPAVLVRHETSGGPTPDQPADQATGSAALDVHVQVPGSGAWLLLSFATPVPALAKPMLDLFDAIAGTLCWVSAAPDGREPGREP